LRFSSENSFDILTFFGTQIQPLFSFAHIYASSDHREILGNSVLKIFILDGAMKISDRLNGEGKYLFLPCGVLLPAFFNE